MKRLLVLAILIALPARAQADNEADARTLVESWLKAQNDHDFAAYTGLYAKKFVGIRRTSDGGEKKMKLKAWKSDRKKMFKVKSMKVAGDNQKITVTKDGAIVTLMQRYEAGSYSDHGTKMLVLVYDAAGPLQIMKEELLSSTPGWDDDPDTTVDASGLTGPITVKVRGEGINPNVQMDCTSVSYVLYLKDKNGKTLSRELGYGQVNVTYDLPTTMKIEPNATKGLIFDMGEWCAGGGDYYRVKWSGDALVVLYKAMDEHPPDEDPADIPEEKFETVLTIQLPSGAKVKAKQ
jgi:hypothetical protein